MLNYNQGVGGWFDLVTRVQIYCFPVSQTQDATCVHWVETTYMVCDYIVVGIFKRYLLEPNINKLFIVIFSRLEQLCTVD